MKGKRFVNISKHFQSYLQNTIIALLTSVFRVKCVIPVLKQPSMNTQNQTHSGKHHHHHGLKI